MTRDQGINPHKEKGLVNRVVKGADQPRPSKMNKRKKKK